MDILETIVEDKKVVLEQSKKDLSLADLKEMPFYNRQTFSLSESMSANGFGILAEIKRKSPSAGNIRTDLKIEDLAKEYEKGGAAGISCLTNTAFFGGSLEDLAFLRTRTKLPLLRKDFLFDEYQIHEAKAYGADAILLICEILSAEEIKNLTNLSHELGLEVLLEVHHPEEVHKLNANVDLIGINNRNLKKQVTEIQQSVDLFDKIPLGPLPITESGISHPDQLIELRKIGYRGALIGESILKQTSPADFITSLQNA